MSNDAPLYLRSSLCTDLNCVEVARTPDGGIVVRDSKNVTQQPLAFTTAEWVAFLRGAAAGEFAPELLPVMATTT